MSSVEEYAGAVVQYYDGTVERCEQCRTVWSCQIILKEVTH